MDQFHSHFLENESVKRLKIPKISKNTRIHFLVNRESKKLTGQLTSKSKAGGWRQQSLELEQALKKTIDARLYYNLLELPTFGNFDLQNGYSVNEVFQYVKIRCSKLDTVLRTGPFLKKTQNTPSIIPKRIKKSSLNSDPGTQMG